MSFPHKSLVLRCNRFLGKELVERGLIGAEDLAEANEKLLEALETQRHKASLLNILVHETEKLREEELIDHQISEEKLPLINLMNIPSLGVESHNLDPDLCYATSSLPFDRIGEYHLIATAFYLSQPARDHWKETIDGRIRWYVTSLQSMGDALQQLAESSKVES